MITLLAALFGFVALAGCDHDHDHDWDNHHARWERERHEDVIVVPARGHDWDHDRDDWHH